MEIGIEDLHLAVGLNVTGGDFALAVGLDIHRLDPLAVQLGDDSLDVENDLGHVLLHAGDGAELMLHPGDLDGGDCRTGQRGEQHPAKGVAQSGAVAPLQRLHHILAIAGIAGILHTLNAGLFDFNH